MTDGQLRGQKHTHWRSCPIPLSIFFKSELPLILYFAWSLVCLILPIVAWNVWQRLYSRWTFFWIDLVSGHTGYVPLVFQAKSGSILKNWYIFCCILDEGDILLSLILRLPEMRLGGCNSSLPLKCRPWPLCSWVIDSEVWGSRFVFMTWGVRTCGGFEQIKEFN